MVKRDNSYYAQQRIAQKENKTRQAVADELGLDLDEVTEADAQAVREVDAEFEEQEAVRVELSARKAKAAQVPAGEPVSSGPTDSDLAVLARQTYTERATEAQREVFVRELPEHAKRQAKIRETAKQWRDRGRDGDSKQAERLERTARLEQTDFEAHWSDDAINARIKADVDPKLAAINTSAQFEPITYPGYEGQYGTARAAALQEQAERDAQVAASRGPTPVQALSDGELVMARHALGLRGGSEESNAAAAEVLERTRPDFRDAPNLPKVPSAS